MLQLQLQLRYTTLHPAIVGEVTEQATTATIATTPQKTQLQPPFSPSVDSLCPGLTTTDLSYRFSIFETSAAALCGTTGMNHMKSFLMSCFLCFMMFNEY